MKGLDSAYSYTAKIPFAVKMGKIAMIAGVIAVIFFVATCSAQAKKKNSSREGTINETLTMVLVVGTEMREQGKHPTWQEISEEVAKRMRVVRKVPWKQ